MNTAVTILGAIGATWLLLSALYWQWRYRSAQKRIELLQRAHRQRCREIGQYQEEARTWKYQAEYAMEALEANTQQPPTLRYSCLDGEPGKHFDALRVDGSGYIVSRN